MEPTVLEYTAENLERLVTVFYRSEALQQAQAHQWLTEAQCCPQAWSFVWELLQPNRTSEVQFFAATTLHTKVLRFWNEVPVEQYEGLRKQILDAIINYANGPKIVLNRLCITLSAYILYTIPNHWPNAFNELLTSFQPHHLPNVSPERVVWILLEILTQIPEEFQRMNFTAQNKITKKCELLNAIKDIIKLVEMYLSSITNNSVSEVDLQTYTNAAHCANAWFQFGGITIEECDNVMTYLLDICCYCYWNRSDPESISPDEFELCESTLEAYLTVITHPHTHKYPRAVMGQIEKMMNKLIKIIQYEHDKKGKIMDIVVNIYSVIISTAECHTKLLIKNLLKKDTREYELSLWVMHSILMCTDMPGINPIDEECSTLSFGFWYMLQDEIMCLEPEYHTVCLEIVKPFYRDLISALLRKSMLPSNDDDPKWTAAYKETLRCHRQDIADTMMYSYEVLSTDLLGILDAKLQEAIKKCMDNGKIVSENWPYIETCLHAYFAIADNFVSEENVHLPRLMEILTEIPYQELNIRVLSTSLDIIGAYASWINEHPQVLQHIIPLLAVGLQNPDSGPSATMAFKDVSRECQDQIAPYANHILQNAQSVFQSSVLRVPENIRLMFTVGKVLSTLPLNSIMEYLNIILPPILNEIQEILKSKDITTAGRSSIIIKLKMLSMLFSTLDTNYKGDRCGEGIPQPTLLVLQNTMPLFSALTEKLCEDAEVMDVLCSVLKYAVITILDDCKPIVNDLLQLLVMSYRVKPLSSSLDVAKQLMLMFGKDQEYIQTMHLLLCEIIKVTLETCVKTRENNQNLSDHTDILEAFYAFLKQLLNKNPDLLSAEGIDILALFQWAIICLGLPELPTVKAAAGFIVKLIGQSREIDSFINVIHTYGEQLVIKVMLCVGGESPRSAVDTFVEILLILNKKYCDFLARWFNNVIQEEGFPSVRASREQKEHFVKAVLKEKANKRKLQEVVKEFSLICRGLIGTEYGNQPDLFL